jgi:catechol 2,3-dioxygenase-like lactoylglutathione lyase family enzyme
VSLTRIDHVMIAMADLDRGVDAYARLGFNMKPGGVHGGMGTHNAIAFLQDDYLELLAIRDKKEYLQRTPWGSLSDFIERGGGGLRYIILQSDDLAADVAAMRSRGVDINDPSEGSRRTPAGAELRWKAALLGSRHALPLFFIQHLTPIEERRKQPGGGAQPNTAQRIERVYIAVNDLQAEAEIYARVLGIQPKIERGTVIMADMAVFQMGASGLTLAQPYGPGPARDALSHRGPGPFQVLFRITSMDTAAKWIASHGVPPPARGVRNTGEHAMLVPPENACGAYIGFVGQA